MHTHSIGKQLQESIKKLHVLNVLCATSVQAGDAWKSSKLEMIPSSKNKKSFRKIVTRTTSEMSWQGASTEGQ